MSLKKLRASEVCQVRSNIRCEPVLDYNTMAKIFRKEIPFNLETHGRYFYVFFEECYPSLIKTFMQEQSISRSEIIDVFNTLPERGEKHKFRRSLQDAKF